MRKVNSTEFVGASPAEITLSCGGIRDMEECLHDSHVVLSGSYAYDVPEHAEGGAWFPQGMMADLDFEIEGCSIHLEFEDLREQIVSRKQSKDSR